MPATFCGPIPACPVINMATCKIDTAGEKREERSLRFCFRFQGWEEKERLVYRAIAALIARSSDDDDGDGFSSSGSDGSDDEDLPSDAGRKRRGGEFGCWYSGRGENKPEPRCCN